MTLAGALNTISLILISLSALAILFPWHQVLFRFQLRRNRKDREDALRHVGNQEERLHKYISGGSIINNFYKIGSIWGALWGVRYNSQILDQMHQVMRKSFNLPAYSLQEPQGTLNRQRIIRSFSDIDSAIRYNYDNSEPRDLRYAALYLLIAGFAAGLLANML